MGKEDSKTIVIAGAGPAGLTAALELASRSTLRPIVFEESDMVGGISRTVLYKGNRIDIGGHRFFSKSERVNQWWKRFLPIQTSPAKDELLLGKETIEDSLHNPEATDVVMLQRRRVSRIYYLRRLFDYPVSLTFKTFRTLGLKRTLGCGAGYLKARFKKLPEKTLEDFYINRFGAPLYHTFFEDYTEKVWGKHPSELSADWGSQRVKGLSISAILRDMWRKKFSSGHDSSKGETSLIENFYYPKYGPGQLWELVGKEAEKNGAEINLNHKVSKIKIRRKRVVSSTVESIDGGEKEMPCDIFISSMPLKDLIEAIDDPDLPQEVKSIASALPYRDFITVGLLVDKLRIKNETKLQTYVQRIPDTWIYVQERDVRLGRIQVFNNWSPYMVADYENKMWIGLEYFCNEGDELWKMNDNEFINMAIHELESIGIIDAKDVEDSIRIKMKKAYPAYFGSYKNLNIVRKYLDSIENLYCIGRNGQHRYNNMDHSMLTAMETADLILSENSASSPHHPDRTSIWNVNTESDYHETN